MICFVTSERISNNTNEKLKEIEQNVLSIKLTVQHIVVGELKF